MPAFFEYSHQVTEDEIDPQGHANNVAYLSWMQSAAIEHSRVQGWSPGEYAACGWAWVVRSHFIEYRRPALLGDLIQIRTWVSDMNKFTSLRKYEILRAEGPRLLARAETNWAFIDRTHGKLMAVPEDVSVAFEIVSE